MRLTRASVVAVVLVGWTAGHAPTDDPKKEPAPPRRLDPKSPQGKLMAEKLRQAQLLLDGLATGDFARITKSADELLIISKAAEFHARKTRQYELHTLSFRRSLEEIAQKSKEKNLDGATLGYVDMTLACVRCHQSYRETKIGRLPGRDNVYFAQAYSGHGLNATHLAGKLLAEAIAGQQGGGFDLFARVPHLTFPGGRHLRSPLLALGMLWYRLKELL